MTEVSTQTAPPPSRTDDPAAAATDHRRARRPRRRSPVLLTLAGAAVAVAFILPLWWTIASALRPQRETFATISPVSFWTLVPRDLTVGNFGRLFETGFGQAILN